MTRTIVALALALTLAFAAGGTFGARKWGWPIGGQAGSLRPAVGPAVTERPARRR